MTNLICQKRFSLPFLCTLSVVLLCLMAGTGFAQGPFGTIKGRVTEDATGNPLDVTNVFLLTTRLGAVSDVRGEYEIMRVPAGTYTIQASYIGYTPERKEITVTAGQTLTVDFALKIDVLSLGEVIVTGMGGTLIKEKLGVAIAKIDPKRIVNSDESSVIAAMAGKVANVEITTTSGDPGASSYIRIRGANTISGGTQPLFIVDGIPINNSARNSLGGISQTNRAADINPEDIESMEILKGAAASAIYGSRAANGVVLITTKSGRPGKTRIEYKTSYSFDYMNKMVPLQTSFGQGWDYEYFKNDAMSWGPKLDASTPVYDHGDEIFETGHVSDNNLTISGGNELTTFFLSMGLLSNDGIFKGKGDYQRAAFRLKATQVVSAKVMVTGNLAYVNTDVNYIQRGSNTSGLLLGALRTPPDFNNLPYMENGLHRSYRYSTPTTLVRSRGYDNPFYILNEHTNQGNIGRVYGSLKMEYDPLDWLELSYTVGSDFTSDDLRRVLPPGSSGNAVGGVNRDARIYHEINSDLIASVNLDKWLTGINENLAGTFMSGWNLNSRKVSNMAITGTEMGVYDFKQLDNTIDLSANEYQSLIHDESFFGQITLDFYDQFFITGAARNDGSSTFSQDDRRHWFPKFSAAWEITKAGMMPKLPGMNYGKLRFAYGQAGSQPNVYSMLSTLGTGNFGEGWGPYLSATYFGYSGYYTSGTKGQAAIKPERTTEIEMGVDLAFMDSRIGIDFTYYSSVSKDVIFGLPIARTTGYTNQVQNATAMENKGVEFTFTANPVRNQNLSWDIALIYGRNRNKVTDLAGAERYSLGGFASAQGYAIEGEPMGVFWAGDWVRFGRGTILSGVDIDAQSWAGPAGSMYIGASGTPQEDAENHIIGDPNPDWTGSIRNDFTLFGKFTITSLIDIKQGGDMWNGTKGALYYFGVHKDTEWREDDYVWDGYGPGQGIAVKRDHSWHAAGPGSGFTGPTVQFIEEASYVKLREISISYPFEVEALKKIGINSINVRVSGRNLKTWTDYSGIDPETNLAGTSNLRGFDYFNNPNGRSYVLTLRLTY